MLTLTPSTRVIRATKLDFGLISFILSRFLKAGAPMLIKVERCRSDWSGYWPDSKVIRIDLKQGTSLKYIISTLLHEIRHVTQIKQIKDMHFNYENYNEYYNSPEERDARKFEKLTVDVCRIYNSYKGIEEKYSKFSLNSFKELIDTSKT